MVSLARWGTLEGDRSTGMLKFNLDIMRSRSVWTYKWGFVCRLSGSISHTSFAGCGKTIAPDSESNEKPLEGFKQRRPAFFFLKYLFIYLFMAVLGLRFCARAFSSCGKRGPLFIAVRGPLTIAASLVMEHRLQTRRLSSCGSRA